LTLALIVTVIERPGLLERLELLGYDQLLAAVPERGRSAAVTVVDVDERSLAELGQWPWPRSQVAQLLNRLREAGARGIGVDFLFAEPDRLSLRRIQTSLRSSLEVDLDLSHLPLSAVDPDLVLAEAVAAPEVVLGVFFSFEEPVEERRIPMPVPGIVLRRTPEAPEAPIPPATRAIFPVAPLAAAAGAAGFLNSMPDIDGTIRRAPLLIEYGGRVFPSLALATVMRARGIETLHGEVSAAGLEEIRIGAVSVPTDRQGSLLLPFARDAGRRFPTLSAADVLAGRIPDEEFAGKLVFIGSSAAALRDTHSTPFDRALPGIEVHALTAATLLEGEFLHRPAWSLAVQVIAVLLAGWLMVMVLSSYRITVCLLVAVGVLAVLWFGAQWLFAGPGLFVSPVAPMLAVVVIGGLLGAARSRIEEKRALASVRELATAQDCAIIGLVSVAETRDPETGFHIIRTQRYVQALAEHLVARPDFDRQLSADDALAIHRSAPLHDIGKVGIPDRVLLKPARLDPDEFEIMKTHAELGHRVLTRAVETSGLDRSNSFLHYAGEIAWSHHEKWDGSGYPRGLAGEEIPLSARIMAVADVYDAIRSRRHYKPACSHQEASEEIVASSGSHFDPTVVRAFLEIQDQFAEIAARFGDAPAEPD